MKTDNGGEFFERTPYHDRHYTLYGGEGDSTPFDIDVTREYLSGIGFEGNSYKKARNGKEIAEHIEATFKPAKAGARYCDFCGTEIFGVEYETLADGRDRCMICGRTAIKTEVEFQKLFQIVKRNMESAFGIRFDADIHVEMVNSQTLHKRLGQAFIPTPEADGRVLGVAISDKKNGYTLLIENGSPRMASMLTMAHELTHIWQYLNWDDKKIRKKYGDDLRLQIYEGMAKWVEVQYAYLINEPAVAKREEILTSYRKDEYGFGFLRYRANYPFSTGTVITRPTPFMNLDDPLTPQFCGKIKGTQGGTDEGSIGKNKKKRRKGGKFWLILLLLLLLLLGIGFLFGDKNGEEKETETNQEIVEEEEEEEEKEEKNEEKEITYYAHETLNQNEQELYDILYEAIMNFEKEVTNIPADTTVEMVNNVMRNMDADHPEIYWHRFAVTSYYDQITGEVTKVEIPYCLTQQEVKDRQAKIDQEAQKLLDTLDESMSEYEIALRTYDFIIQSIHYDTLALEQEEENGPPLEEPDDIRSIYGVFVNKKAVCAGYASAFQYIIQKFGIECAVISNPDHAWNLVKLDGEYYYVDATWGDGSNTKASKYYSDATNYDFFCITTEEVNRLDSHKADDCFKLPECTATACNYYYKEGLVIDSYDLDKIQTLICDALKDGQYTIAFKCSSADVRQECYTQLVQNNEIWKVVDHAQTLGIALQSSYSYGGSEELNTLTFIFEKQ